MSKHWICVRALGVSLLLGAGATAALAQSGSSLGQSGLVGKLEGAELISDPAAVPKQFKEAPQLAELVKQGKLPPVQHRIPQEPLVIKPVKEIGKYGGTWRRGFTGPGDVENGNRINASDKLLFWDYTGTKIVPSVAKAVDMSADGKIYTPQAAQGHEVVRRRAVHGRRFRVLVRGPLLQQGYRADADRRHARSTASPARSSRSTRPRSQFLVRGPLLPVR